MPGARMAQLQGWSAYFPIRDGSDSSFGEGGPLNARPVANSSTLIQDEARARRRTIAVRAAMLSAALAIIGAATAYSRSTQRLGKMADAGQLEMKATWKHDFPSQCGKIEVDVEYQDEESGWGTNYDHIPTPEMCCAMCQGEPKCNAFTWVEDAGLDGCPSQCWLKGAKGKAVKKKGLVSGAPPPRLQLKKIQQTKAENHRSLYCFSLMVPDSYEEKLLLWQYNNKASIFACDAAAVYSNKKITVAPGVTTLVVDSDLKCKYGGDSQSALNAWIFIAVWHKVLEDGGYKKHDWVVKVDPDTVFFPDRLGPVLKDHAGDGYINNCKYGMHGPIEVFSRAAIDALAEDYGASWDGKSPKRCVTEQNFGVWGEDMFIDQCLNKILKVKPNPVDERLMCESHCDCPAWYWCQNGTDRVSFHPFKTVDAYQNCVANAMGGPALPPGKVSAPATSPTPAPEKNTGNKQATKKQSEVSTTSSTLEVLPPSSADEDSVVDVPEKDIPAEQGCAKYGCGDEFDPSRSCQCNPGCASHGSCCPDYQAACKSSKVSTGSCAEFGCGGGFKSENPCQCNAACESYGSCCDDYSTKCGQGNSSMPSSRDLAVVLAPADTEASAKVTNLKTLPDCSAKSNGGTDGLGGGAGKCSDVAEGDDCWKCISWARTHGIFEHAKWFKGLTAESQNADFQAALHKSNRGNCSKPCGAGDEKKSNKPKHGKDDKDEDSKVVVPGPQAQTFYMYRAQSEATYPLENINTADLAGVLWYLHQEVITATPRKYKIDRIKRYKVTVKNTWEFWNAHKRQFSAFVAYDAGRCSTPVCKDIYHQYGFIVGCQKQDLNVAGYLATSQTNWDCEKGSDECNAPVWYSLPGPCPSMGMSNGEINPNKVGLDVNKAKTKECIQSMPGGRCKKASGAPDCTYSYEEAGEVFLDELAGIADYEEFWNWSYVKCMDDVAQGRLAKNTTCLHNKEYNVETDKGVGTDFWNGKHDKKRCAQRMEAVKSLFKMHYPELPADLPEPACEFDMYYDGEFHWAVNHTGAEPSTWWAHRMHV